MAETTLSPIFWLAYNLITVMYTFETNFEIPPVKQTPYDYRVV